LIEAVADHLGSDEEFIKSLDERRREMVEDAVLGFLKNVNTNVNYIRSLKRVVRTIEAHGNAIIVGRGSNYICENPGSFHVRVVATLKNRVAGFAKRENITKNEARSQIKKKDSERAEFVEFNFKKDVTEASDYDITLNSGTFSLDDMMSIVINAYEKKSGRQLKILN
jgi:cytidylate kinase